MKDDELIRENLKIPADVLVDIFALIVREGFKHEVFQVIENRSLVHLTLFCDPKNRKQEMTLKSIKQILEFYDDYRISENEELDWRED